MCRSTHVITADHVWYYYVYCKPTLQQYWRPAHFVVISRFLTCSFCPIFKSGPHRFFEITRQISLVNIDDLFNYFVKLIHTSSKCQDLSRYDPRLSGLKSGPDPTNNANDHKKQSTSADCRAVLQAAVYKLMIATQITIQLVHISFSTKKVKKSETDIC